MRLHRWRVPTRQAGISLLEMLVALVLLAISATVLFDWLYQVNVRMRHLQAQQAQTLAQVRAVQFLNSVNPALQPQGRQVFADFVLDWRAQLVAPARRVLDANDTPVAVELGVYAVHAQLRQSQEAAVWLEFDTRLPGWRSTAMAGSVNFLGVGKP